MEELQEQVPPLRADRGKGTVLEEAPTQRKMSTLNSRDSRMRFSMISSRIIAFQTEVMVKSRLVLHGSASLAAPVVLETEEQMLERQQNELDVLEALGEHKCDTGMSVENVPAVVNIKTLKVRFIAHKFSTGWAVGLEKTVEKKKRVTGQFAVKNKS